MAGVLGEKKHLLVPPGILQENTHFDVTMHGNNGNIVLEYKTHKRVYYFLIAKQRKSTRTVNFL